jgi:arylsulfatase A-like enzyme
VFEGGIRVPFLVSWPGHVPAGRDFDAPVVSLDAFATAVAVSTATVPDPARVEGRNLVPYLSGEKASAPHDHLFWRTGGGVKFAVREGDWKLVAENPQKPLLFNLANDVGESTDLSAKHPEILARLKLAYDNWNKLNVPPLFESPKLNPAKK